MTGILRLILRAAFSITCVLLIIVMMGVTWSIGARRASRAIMQTAFHMGARVWGVHIHVAGELAKARPLIVVSNHFSYLDMFVLGSLIPAAFTPKAEIRYWPVIGIMCKVSGCLFIDRRTSQTRDNKQLLEEALKAGDIISLFPEGTTSDGTGLLPFKSSYFSLAEETDVPVQPISIVYTKLNGKPIDAANRGMVGWYGESYFFPHVAKYLQQKSVDAMIIFHPPVGAEEFASRKEMAAYCQAVIEEGIRRSGQ